jgi:hypothetical protein
LRCPISPARPTRERFDDRARACRGDAPDDSDRADLAGGADAADGPHAANRADGADPARGSDAPDRADRADVANRFPDHGIGESHGAGTWHNDICTIFRFHGAARRRLVDNLARHADVDDRTMPHLDDHDIDHESRNLRTPRGIVAAIHRDFDVRVASAHR